MDMQHADQVTSIVSADDSALTVHIIRVRDTAPVWATYDGREISTPFQTCDMPRDDQAAAAKVNDWLESQA